jgi:chemotaxis signal transduction protein
VRADAHDRKPVRHGEPVILFAVGDNTFAIAATAVDEIRANEGLEQIENAKIPKVRYQLVRDGRTYYVVDGCLYFGKQPCLATRVLVLRNSRVAMLVSYIDRMTEMGNLVALPRAFVGQERSWYRGLTVLNAGSDRPLVVPVVNADSFIAPSELSALTAKEEHGESAARK